MFDLSIDKLIPVKTHLDIRRARILLGLQQKEMAKLINVSASHMSKLENKKAEMKPRISLAIECLMRRKMDTLKNSEIQCVTT